MRDRRLLAHELGEAGSKTQLSETVSRHRKAEKPATSFPNSVSRLPSTQRLISGPNGHPSAGGRQTRGWRGTAKGAHDRISTTTTASVRPRRRAGGRPNEPDRLRKRGTSFMVLTARETATSSPPRRPTHRHGRGRLRYGAKQIRDEKWKAWGCGKTCRGLTGPSSLHFAVYCPKVGGAKVPDGTALLYLVARLALGLVRAGQRMGLLPGSPATP